MADHEGVVDSLRKEYCPPIDEGLFEAIRLDYEDLTQSNNLNALREILDQIRQNATLEEATGFDPSGTSGQIEAGRDSQNSSAASTLKSSENELESIATGLSDFTWEENVKDDYRSLATWDGLSIDEKVKRILGLLPNSNEATIRFTLRQNHNNFDHTMDDLLVLAFLDENAKQNADDVESYAEGAYTNRRKKKGKKQDKTFNMGYAGMAEFNEARPSKNIWKNAQEDIQFIASRTTLPSETVSSLYHSNGASLQSTIKALSLKHSPKTDEMNTLDPTMQVHAIEIAQEYPNLAKERIFGLLIITRNIPSAALELIKAMVTNPVLETSESIKIVPQYAPVQTLAESSSIARPKKSSTSFRIDPTSSQNMAASNRYAGAEAFNKASVAYRRGKSDRHFGGVAAYYADLGREHMKAARSQASAAADSMVMINATVNSIDLHGIGVMDAVRIATDKTQEWWDHLGDGKYINGAGGLAAKTGFKIVTGIGRHSKDGTPRVGPAVTKRLINQGWKIEIGYGELLVTGKRRD